MPPAPSPSRDSIWWFWTLDCRTSRWPRCNALGPEQSSEPEPLDAVERQHIALALKFTGGNKRRTAHLLGIARSTLLAKVRKYRLEAAGPTRGNDFRQETPGARSPYWSWRLCGLTTPALRSAQIRAGTVREGTLSFDGHASAGDFVGKTDSVTGEMTGGATLAEVQGWVEAPVNDPRYRQRPSRSGSEQIDGVGQVSDDSFRA